ncbi:hypothetical protein RJT34_09591 [Clitoria ternatea]|uniref:Uncharacterized protein n=1 Tax=Clitoria ternatea TaxID=43366 RepID=A0AAN9PV71_CLITE
MSIFELVSVLLYAYKMHEFDSNLVWELKTKYEALKRENYELKALKRRWDADSAAFAEVKMENTRMAKAVKHYLDIIKYFRAENNKLACENRKHEEFSESLELTTAMNEIKGPTTFERNGDTQHSPSPNKGKF